jgi:predicted lipoprotein with Yx(FWY)xxD motif
MRTSGIRFVALAAVAAFTFAACSSSSKPASSSTTTKPAPTTTTASSSPPPAPSSATVSLASTKLGDILIDSKGMTLYLDEKDKPGAPSCTGSCLTAWPPLAAPASGSATYGTGLDASKFTTVTASDGTKQLAVDGFPLYTWMNDKKPGDTTGQDVNGFYVVGKDYKKIDPGAAAS